MVKGADRLYLGCGERDIPGFVNVDSEIRPHVDFVRDCRDLHCFDNDSFSLVYACQVLSYFDVEEIPDVLKEWHRVLRPEGILRLSVTNFETLAKFYLAGMPLDYMLGMLYGRCKLEGQSKILYHKTCFDFVTMFEFLDKANFRFIHLWDPRNVDHGVHGDLSQAYFPHMEKRKGVPWNLNIQGQKIPPKDY